MRQRRKPNLLNKPGKANKPNKRDQLKKLWNRHPRIGWLLTILCSLLILSFIIGEMLVLSQFDRDDSEAERARYIIILGSGLKQGDQLPVTLRQRVDTGLTYWQKHQDCKIIVSGGQGVDETVPEAVAMRNYLLLQDVPASAILLESRSTSTYENLLFSRQVMEADGYYDSGMYKAIIVTSNYHMYRARYIAGQLGYTVYGGISSPSPLSKLPISMLREYLALIKTIMTT